MRTVTSHGVTLHVQVDGPERGPVVMLANSLGTDMRVWDPLLPFLPSGLRIVRFDKRGHGLSDCPDAPYDMDTLVSDAETVIDALGVRDVVFVGLSIGGLIGQGLAARRPDLLRALVLMDTAAKIGSPNMWQERISGLRKGGIEGMADAILDRWFAPEMRGDPTRLTPWRNMLTRTPLEGYIGCCAAIAGADFTETTKALKMPVMAMAGSEDGSTTPDMVKATADLCNGVFHVIPNTGHLPCVEAPEQTGALISEFLKEVGHV
ncbi:3-oxoadipate enol-lactonase [Marivita sp. XM-24bin2]|uniref:3-oxoadipate enol-lactonase n=1 Tax=unclassified Marivita TaxID=2632480 RepID=UPI000D7A60DC|nr:3-oxoadipate enol-lactonase [Marivita sp. XM-24bin2]MCR9108938.1 3-oxoadipate enol-lactonase [Paracoccaceae bacterium]PWL36754.1 MAG: 3-oxoadipate enol-lactonase [Marivita sp. XM-24bin2]